MRSRAPRVKWCWHLPQTLRFSSSSLSKIIAAHFGHLVHRPSGMSLFFFFVPESLGFLANEVPPGSMVGCESAGSVPSVPKDFLLRMVVAILMGNAGSVR